MPNNTSILFPSELSAEPLQSRYQIQKLGLKSISITGLICFLSLLTQQPVEGQQTVGPGVIESQAHYSFTAPNAEEYTGSSENVMLETMPAATAQQRSVRSDRQPDSEVHSSADVVVGIPLSTRSSEGETLDSRTLFIR